MPTPLANSIHLVVTPLGVFPSDYSILEAFTSCMRTYLLCTSTRIYIFYIIFLLNVINNKFYCFQVWCFTSNHLFAINFFFNDNNISFLFNFFFLSIESVHSSVATISEKYVYLWDMLPVNQIERAYIYNICPTESGINSCSRRECVMMWPCTNCVMQRYADQQWKMRASKM